MRKIFEPGMSKTIGVYVIIILALIRFMVYPLHGSIAGKKIIFSDLYETFQLKGQHIARQGLDQNKPLKHKTEKEDVAPYLYEKGMPFSSIQTEIVENIVKIAEKKSLTVQNFEMPEPTTGKMISEVPVLIRLAGKPGDLLDVLKTIVSDRKVLQIKRLEMNKSGQDILFFLTLTAFRLEK